jgi:hypothetical protein
VLAALAVVPGCGSREDPIVPTCEDDGRTIAVGLGDEIEISLGIVGPFDSGTPVDLLVV